MKIADMHPREAERLKALEDLKILDTKTEVNYDEITELAAELCESPIALISIIDEKRQWFKSAYGLDTKSTNRDVSFCSHAILGEGIFEVPNSRLDERFYDNPLVTDEPRVIHYAGVPLIDKNKLPMGTLCVIDQKPKRLNESQIKILKVLANQVTHQFELRATLNKITKLEVLAHLHAMTVTYNHEINTPLTVAMLKIEKIQKTNNSDDLKAIYRSLNTIAEVVQSIESVVEENNINLAKYSDDMSMIEIKCK